MLDSYRKELETINLTLIDCLSKRKAIVEKINLFKKENSLNAFDQSREIILFKSLKNEFEQMSVNEMFSFSLIMEDHAHTQNPNYPRWSKQEHLIDKSADLMDGINPIMLALFHKERYDKLNIKFKYCVNINELL